MNGRPPVGKSEEATSMNIALGQALRKLADDIENFRPESVIGEQITVSASVGSEVRASVGPRDPEELQLIHDLREQAERVEAGRVNKTRIQSLLEKAGKSTSAGVTAVASGVVSTVLRYAMGAP
jgi:hypothetical protein